jgi:16S rRNA (adenine1518-N6/adenine1519-N6)-dimethyltransferase
MVIRPSSFYPQPNVDSMGVLLEDRKAGERHCEAMMHPPVFYPLVRALFATRRKTIKNNLSVFIASLSGKNPPDGTSAEDLCAHVLAESALNGKERAETLEPEVFLSLAKSLESVRK